MVDKGFPRYPVIDARATGAHIRKLRHERGYAVSELQQYFGFASPQSVYHWENGASMPRIDNLYALNSREEEYLISLLTTLEENVDSLYTLDFLWHENGTFFMIDGEYFCRQTDKERFAEVLRYLNRIAHYLPHEELECRINEWKLAILKHFADYAAAHIAGTEPSKHMENCVKLLRDIAEQKDFSARFPNDDRDNDLYELDALLGAGTMHCSSGIPEPMGSEYFWYDWGCVGGALERCGGAYHEVIIEHAAVALVTKVLAHLLDSSKVDAATQRLMHLYLALVLFGTHALDDDEVFKDVMRQVG